MRLVKLPAGASLARLLLAVTLLPPAGFAANGKSATARLTVSAAVSLSASLRTIKRLYEARHPEVSIALNLGASGILEQQIEEGAPADVFVSASPLEMNALERQGLLLAGTRRKLVANILVLVCPQQARGVSSFSDLALPSVRRVAMANPESVPAGMYAKQTLEYFKIYNKVEPKLLRAADVRQALVYGETGDADAAIVYLTEAKLSSKVRVVATAPPSSHAPIVYPVAVLKRSRESAPAKRFVDFLFTPEAQEVFEREGFETMSH